MEKEDFKKNSQFKNKSHKKRMYGQFVHEIPEEIDRGLSWKWLVQGDLKVQTEATICAAQEQALRINFTKNKIECVVKGEKLCSIYVNVKLAQREYKRRHDTLQNWSIGNCARSITLKEKRSGMSIALKKL